MRPAALVLCFILLSLQMQAQRYIFFLHGKFIEDAGLDGVHPEYGRAEYKEITDAFRKKGFIIISDVRPKNADGVAYARKVARQADSLMKNGVNPSDITVVGTSKGGYIAQYASSFLKNDKVNFVFIGSCGEYNWRKTHRLSGKLWTIGGSILAAAGLLLPGNIVSIVLYIVIGVICLIPIAYSFILFLKEGNMPHYYDKVN